MADVMDLPPEPLLREDRRKDRSVDTKDRGSNGRDRLTDAKERVMVMDDRKREREMRESRERRDERLFLREERDDRPPRREHHERLSRHDDRMVVSGASEKKEREREHKRRKSPSPPPYPHRIRDRHLLQMRRSPPYKRSRREYEHEVPLRESPRSAGLLSTGERLGRLSSIPGDERYLYDGIGPYNKSGISGGRNSGSSYVGEERSYDRYPNYRSGPGGLHGGPPDWPGPGRTGFSDAPPVSSNRGGSSVPREGLMSYKQFIQELEDDILPAEAERRYEEYKTEFISTQKRSFFEQNKDSDWLREKYDPSQLEAVLARRIENAKTASKDFLAELPGGNFDMCPNAIGHGNSISANEGGMSDEDAEVSGKRRKPAKDPRRDRHFDAAPKAPSIFSEPKRILKDIEQVQALIKKLDCEKGIGSNILTSSEQQKLEADRPVSGIGPIVIVRGANQVKGLEGSELLDVMLSYLWRVHGLDYYGINELKESPNGLRHVRSESKTGEDISAVAAAAAAEWEKKLDSIWESRLQSQDPVEAMLGRDKLEAAATEALDPLVRKIKDEKYGWKYGCGAKGCSKLFHGPEYVHKHLKLKHPEIVNEVILKTREELYFQNYMNDPNAPGTGVVASADASRQDRGKKKRGLLGSAASRAGMPADRPITERGFAEFVPGAMGQGSLHDGVQIERGLARHERLEEINREKEMFDRVDRSPQRDKAPASSVPGPSYTIPSGPAESGGPMEPPLLDPFGGPPIRGPPFVSDLQPPPVLMPVPGAGPLGPFVPAPPEVAMRVWREQGVPPPFHLGAFDGGFESENAGGSRGRRGRRDWIDRPPMIMPGPALQHDPRRVRSYHDLDAPEDEVTVIDYRSL